MGCLTLPYLYWRARRATSGTRPRCVWGPVPILNNHYWSAAVAATGLESCTCMHEYYASINAKADFDLYISDVVAEQHPRLRRLLSRRLFAAVTPYLMTAYALERFDIFHFPLSGGFMGHTPFWRLEAPLLHVAGKKIVIIPYGADNYMYSRVRDPSLRHALLISYPDAAKIEPRIQQHLFYWTRHADFYAACSGFDGQGRWDIVPTNIVTIDVHLWQPKDQYSTTNGTNGCVRVLHTPNHRGVKGTEFLIQAVNQLRDEGLDVELLLLEKVQNAEVRRVMREQADILAEQFVGTAYALSAIEGLATGLTVLANLENEYYTRVARRYGYLNECPVVSTTPENLKQILRTLITNPMLRETLGRAGRRYAEKYHSAAFAQYLFPKIYEKIWYGRDVDLMNLFHPLMTDYRPASPIEHPLTESRLPSSLLTSDP